MRDTRPITVSFCKYSRRWILVETPKKCPNDFCCEGCEHHEMRKPTRHLIRKLRRLEKENENNTGL